MFIYKMSRLPASMLGISFMTMMTSCPHYLVYQTGPDLIPEQPIKLQTRIDDEPRDHTIKSMVNFMTPAKKRHGLITYRIKDETHHFTWYFLKETEEPVRETEIKNQFGKYTMTLGNPKFLLAPAGKKTSYGEHFPRPTDISYYKVYEVLDFNPGHDVDRVRVSDQFTHNLTVYVDKPVYYALPCSVIVEGRTYKFVPDDKDIAFFLIDPVGDNDVVPHVATEDIFRTGPIDLQKRFYLGASSDCGDIKEKDVPFDHFLVYKTPTKDSTEFDIDLKTSNNLVYEHYTVSMTTHFMTPVQKIHNGYNFPVYHKNYHSKWHILNKKESDIKHVLIANQFSQEKLNISEPKFLIVPSDKEHNGTIYPLPDDLDHYQVHEVINYEIERDPVEVILSDQFQNHKLTNVRQPIYVAIPVAKVHGPNEFAIRRADTYLVFYNIDPLTRARPVEIKTKDQFSSNVLEIKSAILIGVPTKIDIVH